MKRFDRNEAPGQCRADRPHEIFAVMNSLRNPRLAEIYLSLVTSSGTMEEIEEARQLIASASAKQE
jgi:hypothetical protein